MRTRRAPAGALIPIMASGTVTVFKLLVATLAVAGAYFGAVTAHRSAGREPPAEPVAEGPTRTVVLSAQSMPARVRRVPQAGMVTVGVAERGAACRSTYHAQSVIDPGSSGDPVVYDWRLFRWSPATRTWKTYLFSGTAGFIGSRRTIEWYPHVPGNPGWYRVELSVSGKGTVVSDKFQIRC